jgi:hypothetical protein
VPICGNSASASQGFTVGGRNAAVGNRIEAD